jgi:transcriptional regulator GlxA family with amidase domain
LSPATALRRLRVELAQSMLRAPQLDGLSVDQIARYSGFASTSALRRRAFDAERITAPSVVRRTREQVGVRPCVSDRHDDEAIVLRSTFPLEPIGATQ